MRKMAKEFDLSAFAVDGGFRLEDQTVENCRIIGTQYRNFDLIHCIFRGVVFENAFQGRPGQYVNIRDCCFTDCEFRDQYRGKAIRLTCCYNTFTDCLIVNMVYRSYEERAEICGDRFINCHFRNIEIQGDVRVYDMEATGGSARYVDYLGRSISRCTFSDMCFEDMLIKADLTDNRMGNVLFRDVTVRGNDIDRNELIGCTNRYTLIRERPDAGQTV